MKKILNICVMMFLGVIGLASCEQGDNYYYDYAKETKVYDGTILDYLNENKGVYDSMLVTLDLIPELRQLLNNPKDTITVFVLPNRGYELALTSLNSTRAITGKAPLYLADLKRNDVDSLMSRYIFKGDYDVAFLKSFNEGTELLSYKYDYRMHLKYLISSSSGYISGGQDQIELSDINNSIFHRYWQSSRTYAVNVKTKNGCIHILSAGHNFGFNKLLTKYTN